MKILFRGAESVIYLKDGLLHKERLRKKYRIEELDTKIIKQRTKKEVNILIKLNALGIPCPVYKHTEGNIIKMEYIDGKNVKDLTNLSEDIFKEIGKLVNILHTNNIIHGDLTTSNFIYKDKIFVIDFGLSYISTKAEDKAVDLYVFEKSVKCAHDEKFIKNFYEGYTCQGNQEEVMTRLELVRKRGRKQEIY
ncbi:BUD32 protein kinase [Vairimorpha necatrix]|uniref:non-specific serine/threonine protein kinase n=1 Tax=Vairimorpha necatrix TaxID=6039 RepID=A0AAX4JC66_9MICR